MFHFTTKFKYVDSILFIIPVFAKFDQTCRSPKLHLKMKKGMQIQLIENYLENIKKITGIAPTPKLKAVDF